MTALPPGPVWLFCPADRPERYAKAAAAADTVILDLEDAVATTAKDRARTTLIDEAGGLDRRRLVVRVNPLTSEWSMADLHAVALVRPSAVLLPKVESAADVRRVRELVPADVAVLATCETVVGVLAARDIAADTSCAGLFWGSEDLTADLNGLAGRDASGRWLPAVEFARNTVRFAAAAAGAAAIDSPCVLIDDDETNSREATEASAAGFHAKACIHPRQVPAVSAGFRPSAEQISWSDAVLTALAERGHVDDVPAAFTLDGRMIDAPLIRLARTIAARDRSGSPERQSQPPRTN